MVLLVACSRKGNYQDNAVHGELLSQALKKKRVRVQWKHYQTNSGAQQDILNYIVMFYNGLHLHSHLDYISPNDYMNQI